MMNEDKIKKMIIIAFSSGYEQGHFDTLKDPFRDDDGSGLPDVIAKEWAEHAIWESVFDRELNL
ncbi:MAG: hypothetical protein O7D95_02995 [Betaproteobacteria bacterium]|nr:hypothetical protein [Betaproteobacteria bacterium]